MKWQILWNWSDRESIDLFGTNCYISFSASLKKHGMDYFSFNCILFYVHGHGNLQFLLSRNMNIPIVRCLDLCPFIGSTYRKPKYKNFTKKTNIKITLLDIFAKLNTKVDSRQKGRKRHTKSTVKIFQHNCNWQLTKIQLISIK